MAKPYSRRDFVALSVAGPLVGWLPWFRPKELAVGEARFRIVRNHRSTRRYVFSMAIRMPCARCFSLTWNRSVGPPT